MHLVLVDMRSAESPLGVCHGPDLSLIAERAGSLAAHSDQPDLTATSLPSSRECIAHIATSVWQGIRGMCDLRCAQDCRRP